MYDAFILVLKPGLDLASPYPDMDERIKRCDASGSPGQTRPPAGRGPTHRRAWRSDGSFPGPIGSSREGKPSEWSHQTMITHQTTRKHCSISHALILWSVSCSVLGEDVARHRLWSCRQFDLRSIAQPPPATLMVEAMQPAICGPKSHPASVSLASHS